MLRIIIYLLCAPMIISQVPIEPILHDHDNKHNGQPPENQAVQALQGPVIDINNNANRLKPVKNETVKHASTKGLHTTSKNIIDADSKVNSIVNSIENAGPEESRFESGTLIRGICVMVALSFIFIIYLGIKTYSKKSHKSNLVRKYGIRTRRNDVEMEPLPLSDDDEDETVFDLGNVANKN